MSAPAAPAPAPKKTKAKKATPKPTTMKAPPPPPPPAKRAPPIRLYKEIDMKRLRVRMVTFFENHHAAGLEDLDGKLTKLRNGDHFEDELLWDIAKKYNVDPLDELQEANARRALTAAGRAKLAKERPDAVAATPAAKPSAGDGAAASDGAAAAAAEPEPAAAATPPAAPTTTTKKAPAAKPADAAAASSSTAAPAAKAPAKIPPIRVYADADKDRFKNRLKLFYENHHKAGLPGLDANAEKLKTGTFFEAALIEGMCKKYDVPIEQEQREAAAQQLLPRWVKAPPPAPAAEPPAAPAGGGAVAEASPPPAPADASPATATPPAEPAAPAPAAEAAAATPPTTTPTASAAKAPPSAPPSQQLPPIRVYSAAEKERFKNRLKLFYENHHKAGLPGLDANLVKIHTGNHFEPALLAQMCGKYGVAAEQEQREAAAAKLLPTGSTASTPATGSSPTTTPPRTTSPGKMPPIRAYGPQDKQRFRGRLQLFYENHHKAGLDGIEANLTKIQSGNHFEEVLIEGMCKKYNVPIEQEQREASAKQLLPGSSSDAPAAGAGAAASSANAGAAPPPAQPAASTETPPAAGGGATADDSANNTTSSNSANGGAQQQQQQSDAPPAATSAEPATDAAAASSGGSGGKKVFGKRNHQEQPAPAAAEQAPAAETPAPASTDDATTTASASSGKKVFGKRAAAAAADSAPAGDGAAAAAADQQQDPAAVAPAAAVSSDEAASGGSSGKKVFGKKRQQQEQPADGDGGGGAAAAASAGDAAAAGAGAGGGDQQATAAADSSSAAGGDAAASGEASSGGSSGKKVFGKKKRQQEDGETDRSSETTSVTPSATAGDTPVGGGGAAASAPLSTAATSSDAAASGEASSGGSSGKKVFGKKKKQQEDGETASTTSAATGAQQDDQQSSSATATAPEQMTVEQQQEMARQRREEEEAEERRNELHTQERRELDSRNPLSSSGATWDDWFDEVCRIISRLAPPQPSTPPPSPSASSESAGAEGGGDGAAPAPTRRAVIDPASGGPSCEAILQNFSSLIPSARSASWLLIEKRYPAHGEQRVSLLWRASAAGWVGMVEAVLKQALVEDPSGNMAVRLLLDSASGDGTSALYMAAQNNHAVICSRLLDAAKEHGTSGVFAHVLNHQRGTGATPLFIATQSCHTAVIDLLLEHGADSEIVNNQRATPLVLACSMDSAGIVEKLLRAGARWRDRRTGRGPLQWAGPNARVVLETFIQRREYFHKWRIRIQQLKELRAQPTAEELAAEEARLAAEQDALRRQQAQEHLAGVASTQFGAGNEAGAAGRALTEEEEAEQQQRAMLAAMLLSFQRKQTRSFLVDYNAERIKVVEAERIERRELSYAFAISEPVHLGVPLSEQPAGMQRFFSPELQPAPTALKPNALATFAQLQQREAAAGGGASSGGGRAHRDPAASSSSANDAPVILSQQSMLGVTSTPAPGAHLQRPSVDAIVRVLNQERADLAAHRQPATHYGLPVNPPREPGPQQPSTRALGTMAAPTNPNAARAAADLDFSRRREFEWTSRLHRLARLEQPPDPRMYASNYTPSDQRLPLSPPAKGVRY